MRSMELLTLLNICDSFVMSTAPNGIHMTTQDLEMGQTCAKLEKNIVIYTLGTFFMARRNRLRNTACINTPQETKGLRCKSLKKRFVNRADKLKENKMSRNDQKLVQEAEVRPQPGQRWTIERIALRGSEDNRRRQRKLPPRRKRSDLSRLRIKNVQVKRAQFQLHCGSFPPRL